GVYANLQEALKGIKASKVHEPSLNYAICSQAYNYWLASLNKVLNGVGSGAAFVKDLKLQNEDLKKKLKDTKKLTTTQSLQLQSQKTALTELENSLQSLKKESKSPVLRKKINQLIYLISNNQDTSNTLEEHLELLDNEFVQKLKKQHPQLSFEELKLSLFLQMKLSTKEIAARLNLSIRGVETKRYRLRKKLGLTKRSSLDAFFGGV
ncbi:MAG: helix-turn-helix transcriptional regulator, partial [Chitinophagales bacterium]